jgi:hypothetical protein
MSDNAKYDPAQQKKFFKNVVDMYKNIHGSSNLEVVESNFKLTPHHWRITRESYIQLESFNKSQKVVDLWFQLFFDILDDEQLTEKLWNAIKTALGVEGNLGEYIFANLLERKESHVKRRKKTTGREFWLNAQLDCYEIEDIMLYLGSNVNILPNKTWEEMGKPKLFYSPI